MASKFHFKYLPTLPSPHQLPPPSAVASQLYFWQSSFHRACEDFIIYLLSIPDRLTARTVCVLNNLSMMFTGASSTFSSSSSHDHHPITRRIYCAASNNIRSGGRARPTAHCKITRFEKGLEARSSATSNGFCFECSSVA